MRRFTVEQGIAEIALTAHNKETLTIATVIYIQALQIGHQRSIVPAMTHRQHLTPGAAIGRCSKFMNAPFFHREVKQAGLVIGNHTLRSEERRVGKECRARWWPCH